MRRAVGLPEFRSAALVASYVGMGGEVDPGPHLPDTGATIALPVTRRGEPLRFVVPDGALVDGPYGTLQPEAGTEVEPRHLDLVLVPLVVADRSGNRLGHGAGYYDRTFAFRRRQAAPPLLVGLAHAFQVVERLEPEPWDVPLDMVVSGAGILRPGPPMGED